MFHLLTASDIRGWIGHIVMVVIHTFANAIDSIDTYCVPSTYTVTTLSGCRKNQKYRNITTTKEIDFSSSFFRSGYDYQFNFKGLLLKELKLVPLFIRLMTPKWCNMVLRSKDYHNEVIISSISEGGPKEAPKG